MATPTDASFGAGFDAAAFRAAIEQTMIMGLPVDAAERATFRWKPERTFSTADPAGRPYSWTDTPATEDEPADVQIPVAVEFEARPAGSADTVIGQFDAARAVITVLDAHYPQVAGANFVILGGDTYQIDLWAPPVGLFDATIHTVYATAIDEV